MFRWFGCCCGLTRKTTTLLDSASNIVSLLTRVYIFDVFFSSAMTKINDFATTKYLFEHEYNSLWLPLPPSIIETYSLEIPKMPVELAAYLGTGLELVIPILLLLGLGGRLPALILFAFNYVAAVSYPFLWTKAGLVGLQNHYFWGALLMMLVFYGCGKISFDHIIKNRHCHDMNRL